MSKHHHHHHHVVPLVQISLTFSRHFSLSFIVSGKSSGLHPISSHSCWMYVRAGRPAFARPYVGVRRSTSLMSSSLLLQQCPACLVQSANFTFLRLQFYIRISMFLPSTLCLLLFLKTFCTTCEMPTRLSVGRNSRVHSTWRMAKQKKKKGVWVI